MIDIEDILTASVLKNGEVPLTNKYLLHIIRLAKYNKRKREYEEEKFLTRIAAECTDPND